MLRSIVRGIALVIALVGPSGAGAAEKESEETGSEVTPEMRQAIDELVALTYQKDPAELAKRGALAALLAQYPLLMRDALLRRGLEEGAAMKLLAEHGVESRQRFAEAVSAGLERLSEIGPAVQTAIYGLYNANYSFEELETLIEFFHTPTGRKYARLRPLLIEEGARLTARIVGVPITRLTQRALEDERDRLESAD